MSKEIPILFNGDMVRAILSGSKTQTRRPIKNMPRGFEPRGNPPEMGHITSSHPKKGRHGVFVKQNTTMGQLVDLIPSPFGKTGDVLWVRETYYQAHADKDILQVLQEPYLYKSDDDGSAWYKGFTWTPSIHMPKDACRIKLKVKRVWVERVQDITYKDARSEGAPPSHPSVDKVSRQFGFRNFTHSWFGQMWDSIYGTWGDNPWVWACEFEVISNNTTGE